MAALEQAIQDIHRPQLARLPTDAGATGVHRRGATLQSVVTGSYRAAKKIRCPSGALGAELPSRRKPLENSVFSVGAILQMGRHLSYPRFLSTVAS
jgi:hypothetical protein